MNTPETPASVEHLRKILIHAIVMMYHTTRLGPEFEEHILSKWPVRQAFDDYEARLTAPASVPGENRGRKVYLASRFSRRHDCHALGKVLQAQGYEIVSRWTKPGDDHVIPSGSSEQAADSERRRFAMEDCEDLRSADWCISLMEQPRGGGRGGRHIEFGYALALGKRLTIIGPCETVFHHLDEVERFETVEDFTSALTAAPPAPFPTNKPVEEDAVIKRLEEWRKEGSLCFDNKATNPHKPNTLASYMHSWGWVIRDLRTALDKTLAAAPQPPSPTGEDLEQRAYTWLESRYLNAETGDDPADRSYDQDEMVDAFIAGFAQALAMRAGERG